MEKNKALARVEELKEIKAYFKKEEFPIEIMSIPTSLYIAHRKDADNRSLIEALKKANNTLNPIVKITRISWIYRKKLVETRLDSSTRRYASLLIHLTIEAT